jgi:hypothetical protein
LCSKDLLRGLKRRDVWMVIWHGEGGVDGDVMVGLLSSAVVDDRVVVVVVVVVVIVVDTWTRTMVISPE